MSLNSAVSMPVNSACVLGRKKSPYVGRICEWIAISSNPREIDRKCSIRVVMVMGLAKREVRSESGQNQAEQLVLFRKLRQHPAETADLVDELQFRQIRRRLPKRPVGG